MASDTAVGSVMGTPPQCLSHPLAIIGLAGRYPGAPDLDTLWANLRDGVDAVGEMKGDRWDLGHAVPGSSDPNRFYTNCAGLLDRVDAFDAEFFGMSPREAKQVDPQHRLMLELTWEALEGAGLVPARLAGSATGVFVGISASDYATLTLVGESPDAYTNIGSAVSIAANRISYVFDFHGPSMSVDTACSSSLVALHQACRALAAGEIDLAVSGGVNMLLSGRPFVGFARASMLSPDGRCKSFDASGNGYVRAEGGGIVLIKRLADAERDGDPILAVIRASGVNSDGRTMGLALPNGAAQEALLRQVYGAAGIPPERVFYVEAHGTGTAAGDPIECGAIARVLGQPRADGSVCRIGSVKSNIGHLESGAGIAGLTKALLALRHREIPPNLHFRTPNPKIEFEAWKLRVVDTPTPLPETAAPLVIGINSFGFGGTNAHLVLEEYRPAAAPEPVAARPGPAPAWDGFLILSAHNQAALEALADRYIPLLEAADPAGSQALRAATLRLRSLHPLTLPIVAENAAAAAAQLRAWRAGEAGAPQPRKGGRTLAAGSQRAAFVFSGNGPQWWGMGRELLAECAAYREAIASVDAHFAPLAGWSLIERMGRGEDATEIGLTEVAQPMLFAQQVALVTILAEAGITPAAVFGHSVGEVAAAWASGALSLEQATQVIFQRSRQQALTRGAGRMAALGVSRDEAAAAIAAFGLTLEIAAINAPRAVTVAGPAAELEALEAHLAGQGHFVRILPLDYAFHTRAMDPIEQGLRAALDGLAPGAAQVPMISTVTGETLAGAALDAGYWWENIRAPVAFDAAARHAVEVLGLTTFIEIGPHPVLVDYLGQIGKALGGGAIVALATLRRPSARRAAPELPTLRLAIAEAYAAGAGRPERLFPEADRRLPLPGLAWQRQCHWRGHVELPDAAPACLRDHPLLGARTPGADGAWTNTLQTRLHPYLKDHRIQDAVIFPAAGYIEMLLAAGRAHFGEGPISLEAFDIQRPLVLAEGAEPIAQTALDGADGTLSIRSRPDRQASEWTLHCRGRASRPEGLAPPRFDVAGLRAALPVAVSAEAHFAECERRGLHYGAAFQGLRWVALSEAVARTRLALSEVTLEGFAEADLAAHHAHPALVDGCLQTLIALIAQGDPRACATIPVFVDRILSFGPVPARVFCRATLLRESARSGVADIEVADAEGRVVLQLLGARFQKVEFNPATLSLLAEDWRIDPAWQPGPGAPLALPALEALVAAAAPQAAPADARVAEGLDRLAGAHALAAIRTLAEDAESFTIASLALAGEVVEEQRPLLRALIAIAEADGALLRDATSGRWRFAPDAEAPAPGALLRALLLDRPAWSGVLIALSTAGAGLVARLRGETEGRPASAETLEEGAPSRHPAQEALIALLRAAIAAWPEGRPIRLLECDGRGGGLAAAVLPVLPPARSDYLSTDPDEAMVGRAEHRLARHHFFRAATYDAASVPEEGFDIVLTAQLADPERLARHLVPGGLLIALHPLPNRALTLLGGMAEAAPPASPALLGERQVALASTGPCGAELVIARRTAPAQGPAPALAPDARRRTVIASAAEDGTPFLRALLDGLSQGAHPPRLRLIGADDLSDEAMARLVAEAPADEFIHLAGWHRAAPAEDLAAMLAHQDLRCTSLAPLVRAIEEDAARAPEAATGRRLCVVTRGALASMARGPLDPFQATAYGFVRVLANEHPGLEPAVIDLHAEPDDADAGTVLARRLLLPSVEAEMQLVDGLCLVNRVRETSHGALAPSAGAAAMAESFRLECRAQGGLDSLTLAAAPRRAPAADEVELRVAAAGLNFRDVLWAMGMLPEEAVEHGFSGATIGMECAGIVERVGAAVTHLRPGDRAMGFASSTFASHVTTRADGMGALPDTIGLAEGATIPTTFITAWYALDHLARLRAGESILIHGAAGGVGLAALQIAKMKGAVVFATAGAAEKQRLVRDMGADHVLSSRSLAFAEQVMAITGGKGVDVVLNSLAGEAITRSLGLLKPFGRFLEIGKRDLYANSRIGLRPFRRNLSYFGIDADTLLVERPDLATTLFAEIADLLARGALRPLPFQSFPIERAAEAFRLMQASRHIGKIIITLPEAGARHRPMVPDLDRKIDFSGTYVVTGGLSGFGLATARWLAAQGVRALALMGRRGAETEEAAAALAWFAAEGVAVKALAVDVADRAALAAALETVRRELPPIAGVIHAAAVIEDAPVIRIQPDLAHRVQAAKMQGAWNLHALTADDPIRHFILYSSSSAVVGNPGQAIYVGANLFLDALAQLRRAEGRPALAVGWGAIGGAGFLTRNAHVEEMLASRSGMRATPVAEALAELGRLLAIDATRVAASQFNLMRLGQSLPATRRPRFVKLVPQGVSVAGAEAGALAAALAAMSEAERAECLTALVREQVARVIGAAASQIEPDKTLAEMGLDSLMAVELAEALENEIGRPVSVMQMIQAGTVAGVVAVVMRGFRTAAEAPPAPVPAAAPADAA